MSSHFIFREFLNRTKSLSDGRKSRIFDEKPIVPCSRRTSTKDPKRIFVNRKALKANYLTHSLIEL